MGGSPCRDPALADLPIEWHFIGRIQGNKTRQIAERFSWVHSLCDAQHARRLEVGDAIFFDILRTYCDYFDGDSVATLDFITVAEAVSGQDLQSFFSSWLYSDEVAPIPSMGLEPE